MNAPELASRGQGGGERDGIVERQTERVMGDVVALPTVEQVLLEVISDGKETTAGRIGGTVHTIGAEGTLDGGTCRLVS